MEYSYVIGVRNMTVGVKIGRSATPLNRLQGLQTANLEELALLGVSSKLREYDLHCEYRKYRVRGEWFKLPIKVYIDLLRRFNSTELLGEPEESFNKPRMVKTPNAVRKGLFSKIRYFSSIRAAKKNEQLCQCTSILGSQRDENCILPAVEGNYCRLHQNLTEVKAKPTAEVKAKPTAEVKAKPTAEVKAKPTAEVKAKPTAEVKAKPTAEVKAKPTAEVKAKPTAEVKAKPTAEVKAKPTAEVKAKPTAEVKAKPTAEVKAKPTAEVKAEVNTQSVPSIKRVITYQDSAKICRELLPETLLDLRPHLIDILSTESILEISGLSPSLNRTELIREIVTRPELVTKFNTKIITLRRICRSNSINYEDCQLLNSAASLRAAMIKHFESPWEQFRFFKGPGKPNLQNTIIICKGFLRLNYTELILTLGLNAECNHDHSIDGYPPGGQRCQYLTLLQDPIGYQILMKELAVVLPSFTGLSSETLFDLTKLNDRVKAVEKLVTLYGRAIIEVTKHIDVDKGNSYDRVEGVFEY